MWLFLTLPEAVQPPAMILAGSLLGLLIYATKMKPLMGQISTRKFWVAVMWFQVVMLPLGVFWLVTADTQVATQGVPDLFEPQVTFVTADWCPNCALMKTTLRDFQVVERMQELGIELTVLDYTNRPPEVTEFLVASYGTDVPVLRVVSITGKVTVLSGMWTSPAILRALE